VILQLRFEERVNIPQRYVSTEARVQAYYETQRGWEFVDRTTESDGSVTLRFWEARGVSD